MEGIEFLEVYFRTFRSNFICYLLFCIYSTLNKDFHLKKTYIGWDSLKFKHKSSIS